MWGTPVGDTCGGHLWGTPVGDTCGGHLWGTPVGGSCLADQFTFHHLYSLITIFFLCLFLILEKENLAMFQSPAVK